MFNRLRQFLLLLSLSGLATGLWQAATYWDYQEVMVDIGQELRLKVNPANLEREIEHAIEQSDFKSARMYLSIAREHKIPLDYTALEHRINTQDTRLRKVGKQISRYADGFINGKGSSAAGIAGAVSADFTVIGDARDLYHEYEQHRKGKPVNELIVALSGAGIGLTALSVASLGSSIPVKSGLSLVKLAAKTGRLTARFQKVLLRQGRKVFDWAAFTRAAKQSDNRRLAFRQLPDAARQAYHPEAIAPLKKLASQLNRIRHATSASDTLHLLKYVDNARDLQRLEKVTLKYGSRTRGIMKLLGKGALRTTKVLKKSAELLLGLISSLVSGFISLLLLMTGKRPSFKR